LHPKFWHRIGQFFSADVEGKIDLHFAGEVETIRIDVGNNDVTRAGLFADRNSHATDRAGAGDEHIFADEIERERGVNGVAEWIETGKHLEWDRRISMPAI